MNDELASLVFLVADHHHTTTCRLINDRCTFGCMSQCIAFIVAFGRSLARGGSARILDFLRVGLLNKDKGDILLCVI